MGYSDLMIEIEVKVKSYEGIDASGYERKEQLLTDKTLQDIADLWGDGWKVETFPSVIVDESASWHDITISNLPMLVHDEAKCGFNLLYCTTGSYTVNYHIIAVMYNYETGERKQIDKEDYYAYRSETIKVLNASYYTKYIGYSQNSYWLFTQMIDRYDNRKLKWYAYMNGNLLDLYRLAILQNPQYPPSSANTSLSEGAIPYVVLVPLVVITQTEEVESPNIFKALYDTRNGANVLTKVIDGKEYLFLNLLGGLNTYIRIGDGKEK